MMISAHLLFASCLSVNAASDTITAADLAPRFPGLEMIPGDTPLGLAPAPGAARVFRTPELRGLAARFGVPVPNEEICFQRRLAPLDAREVLAAMRRALPQARIELLELSRYPAPEGELEFSLDGLRNGPAGALWRGNVRYAGNRLFAIWARIRVRASVARVIASEDIAGGEPIIASQIAIESRDEFPSRCDFAAAAEEVIGKRPRSPIRRGAPIRLSALQARCEVCAGDTVEVDAWNGAAHLKFDGRAEGPGALGQIIAVRNPVSQKRFSARVTGKGKVSVGEPSLQGNQ